MDPGKQEVQADAGTARLLVRQSSSDEWPDSAWHPLGRWLCKRAAGRLSQHREEAWAQVPLLPSVLPERQRVPLPRGRPCAVIGNWEHSHLGTWN